ncbi:MAG: glycosyltransferase [Lutibacter sp.]|uniref:glycosyltransferase n=1 Tax=Lutibacter sp. TaxID=1925666 RepID=UPI0019FD2375|nr:glycosyltransferase [Lutibacter sp.]NOR27861.1 glycosyltransferase [Lutibacter sp.]
MKRIIVSVTNDLVTDQRVHKVCTTLTEMNFDVLLIGRKLKNSKKINRNYKTTRMKLLFTSGFLFYSEYNLRLFFKLLFLKKDILLSNDLDTLLPNYLISKLFDKKLVYDSHELFTELPSIQGRYSQKIWRFLEKWLVPKQKHFYTVSDSIANWFHKKYDVKPLVIKNFPNFNKSSSLESKDKYILYQGALNNGRGLLALIEAMQTIENVKLKIAGDGPIKSKIQEQIKQCNVENKVVLLGNLEPEKLLSITQNATLGISLEEDLGLSYKYSLPNKLFDYIQAKTPVVATYLPEIKKVIKTYGVGEIIDNHTPENIATIINKVLKNEKKFYNVNLEKASKELVWESQEEKLISIFRNV